MKQVDMSEKAILSRLRQVDKLRTLCLSLMKAKKVTDTKRKSENGKDESSPKIPASKFLNSAIEKPVN